MRNWLRFPGRLALLLGMGALSAAGAQAETSGSEMASSQASGLGTMLIRIDAGRIYLAENGSDFRELVLPDNAETAALRQLLESRGAAREATGIRIEPIILAGDGGSGFSWSAAPGEGTGAGRTRTGAPAATSHPHRSSGKHKAATAPRPQDKG
jgi:hypothetical protein